MIDAILYILAFAALAGSSVADIKKREVPDWISYGFLSGAIGIRLIYSILASSYSFFLQGVLGALVFFGVGYIFYKAAQWGGGDVKISAGIGAVFGLTKLSVLFVVLLLFAGAFYGMVWSIYLAVKNSKQFKNKFILMFKQFKILIILSVSLLILSLLLFVSMSDKILGFLFFGIAAVLFVGVFSFLFVKAVEDSCMYKKIKSNQLTEGDWVAETIRMNGKIVIKEHQAATIEQMKKLKHYRKPFLIKIGIPFVPAFFIAFVALFLFKDLLLAFF